MTIKCADCGKFIPYADMESGLASFEYTPDSDRSTELCLWICNACVIKEQHNRDEQLATLGLQER